LHDSYAARPNANLEDYVRELKLNATVYLVLGAPQSLVLGKPKNANGVKEQAPAVICWKISGLLGVAKADRPLQFEPDGDDRGPAGAWIDQSAPDQ